ncbi:MAG: MogA/MoaB family molybdenum cofactor biosynthesis protein [bacterium]|nr:MogA/MoaB family molybdenum cofactor biosynthesis protein [bacterium]
MYKAGILIISDKGARGERKDLCREVIEDTLKRINIVSIKHDIIPDEENIIYNKLIEYIDSFHLNIIITSGGTGIGPRDVTPEATKKAIEKEIPGIAEAMRLETFKFAHSSLISRSVVGIRKQSIIINLPGSPKACQECLKVILSTLPHAIDMVLGKKMECANEIKNVSK